MSTFWDALERLNGWKKDHIPGAETRVGQEVLIWLVKSKTGRRSLKDLYRSSRFSEPTIRNCLRRYCDMGYVVIRANDSDTRTRFAVATAKLDELLVEYRARIAEFAQATGADAVPLTQSPLAPSLLPAMTR